MFGREARNTLRSRMGATIKSKLFPPGAVDVLLAVALLPFRIGERPSRTLRRGKRFAVRFWRGCAVCSISLRQVALSARRRRENAAGIRTACWARCYFDRFLRLSCSSARRSSSPKRRKESL
ncbi:hypothetical protein AOLI_G00280090 [Acnodon oligacanthus]